MGIPTLKLMFDRRKRASKTKEGAIELRIGYDRKKKYATTGVRVFPREWRNGYIVHRLDAAELQRTLDVYVANARKIINDLMERGEFDMDSIVAQINGRQKKDAAKTLSKNASCWTIFASVQRSVSMAGRATVASATSGF